MSDKKEKSKKKKSIWRNLIDRRARANKEVEVKAEITSTNYSTTDTGNETTVQGSADFFRIPNDTDILMNDITESNNTAHKEKIANISSSILREKKTVIEENRDTESQVRNSPNTMLFTDDRNLTGITDRISSKKEDNEDLLNDISDETFFNQGRNFYLGEGSVIDIPKAMELFSKSAELGNKKACYVLYKIYYQTHAGKELAIQYLKKAADLNYLPAMYDLAIHLLHGDDTDKNTEEAIRLLDKCAEKGDQSAISKLFYLYRVGLGNKADRKKAEYYRGMLRI